MENELQYVLVDINNLRFAVDVGYVNMIIKNNNFTRVPGSLYYYKGLINYRGDIVAVVDLKKKLFLIDDNSNKQKKRSGRIILVKRDDKELIGLRTDSATEVKAVKTTDFLQDFYIPENIIDGKAFISAAFKVENEIVYVIDINNMLMNK
ncbi:MAG: chemotaxis protein CheW [Lachnospiraceae bacterium]|nr:chemotaxis protein CheW [Lachnospiraceae bacterium]